MTLFTTVKAQLYPGVTLGYQINGLHEEDGKSWVKDESSGFRVGGFIDKPLWEERYGIRLEASYSQTRFNKTQSPNYMRLHYLSTPLSFFYTPNRQVQLFIGPQLNTLLKQKGEVFSGVNDISPLDRFDFGVHGSLEIFFATNCSVAFRYYQGLKYNSQYTLDTGGTPERIAANRISSIQLCLNYIFSAGKDNDK